LRTISPTPSGIWMQSEKTKFEKETGVSSGDDGEGEKSPAADSDAKSKQQDNGESKRDEPAETGSDYVSEESEEEQDPKPKSSFTGRVRISSQQNIKALDNDEDDTEDSEEEAEDAHTTKKVVDSPFRDPVAVLFEKILEG